MKHHYIKNRIRNYISKVAAVGLAVTLACMPVSVMADGLNSGYTTSTYISNANINKYIDNAINTDLLKNNVRISGTDIDVDGDASDWKYIKERQSYSDKVSSWKVAIASDYSVLYICYQGMTSSQWDYNYAGAGMLFTISYANDALNNNYNNGIQFTAWENVAVAKDAWYRDIQGAGAATVNEAHQSTPGPYVLEGKIPMDFFADSDFTIIFAGTTVAMSDVEVLGGEDVKEEETTPVYEGITIDGDYKDWDAVTKYDAECPNEAHKDCISQTAMVFDGDYVYIYVKDGDDGSAYGAGTHSNGRYSIKTDLGNELVFQLTQDGNISGINSAECIHVGKQWEIAIPKTELPAYNRSLSFGLYLSEPFVSDVANLDGLGGNDKDNTDKGNTNFDIEYDGVYGDWEYYPHTTIEYATAGTQQDRVDAQGALYCSGSTLYGHVVTTMPQHLEEAGGEFMNAVTIKFNDNYSQVFYPRMESVDSAGNINWNTPKGGLEAGTYEFYLFSTDAWHNSDNINNANDMDKWYGKITITIREGRDECEFYLDLEKVAAKLGCDVSDFKQIDAQFGRLGQQWITTAGASSGAWLGLVLCIGVTVGVLIHKGRKSEL